MEDITVVPSKKEKEDALAVLPQIEVISRQSASIQLGSVKIIYGDVNFDLPPGAVKLLTEAIKGIAEGKTMQLSEVEDEVTTQEAAEILNVSRPHVVRLFDKGIIPGRVVGDTHRRMLRSDVEAYKKQKAEQLAGMIELTRLSQEMGLAD